MGNAFLNKGVCQNHPKGGGAKNGWRIQIPMFILFFGEEGGVE